jgi:hypothetical protein
MWRSRALTAVAACVALAACGSPASRVEVDRDQTDIVFGFTTPSPRPAPTAAAPKAPPPEEAFVPFTPKPFERIFKSEPTAACPTAEPNAPIEGSAGTEVKGRPLPGTYAWKASGHTVVAGHDIPLVGDLKHYVRSVETYEDAAFGESSSGDAFTYEEIEPTQNSSGAGLWLFAYQTKADSTSADPEAGLVLKRIDALKSNGGFADTFFSPFGGGLLMVPFPIKAGQTWNTATVDFQRQRTFQLTGQVLRREAVDVCGKLIQGWHVDAEIVGAGTDATVDYIVSGEHAGQIIAVAIDGTYLGVTYKDAAFHTAALEPKPLPEELEK